MLLFSDVGFSFISFAVVYDDETELVLYWEYCLRGNGHFYLTLSNFVSVSLFLSCPFLQFPLILLHRTCKIAELDALLSTLREGIAIIVVKNGLASNKFNPRAL